MKQKTPIHTLLPTKYGNFKLLVWPGKRGLEPIALTTKDINPDKEVVLRVHSECITGDTFGALTCDCGQQKEEALKLIKKHGNGIFIYHRQEGRNMGVYNKIKVYQLMKKGIDTHKAAIMLVGSPDARSYEEVLTILHLLLGGQKSKLILLSNNPYKKLFLERDGYDVEMRSLDVGNTKHNALYKQTKKAKFLHYQFHLKPYVGITLFQEDLNNPSYLKKMFLSFNQNLSRYIFIGIPINWESGDFGNKALITKINNFFISFEVSKNIKCVFHMNFSNEVGFMSELKKFLSKFSFDARIQFRIHNNTKMSKKLLQLIGGKVNVFQVHPKQKSFLNNRDFLAFCKKNQVFILIDNSFGSGVVCNYGLVKKTISYCLDLGLSYLAVAGGFDGIKASKIFNLEDFFKIPISVDAETNLRSEGKLDLKKTQDYLSKFIK